MDDITIRIESPKDFKLASDIIRQFFDRLSTSFEHTEYNDKSERWLVGQSVPINSKTILHFFVASKNKNEAIHGYHELIEYTNRDNRLDMMTKKNQEIGLYNNE